MSSSGNVIGSDNDEFVVEKAPAAIIWKQVVVVKFMTAKNFVYALAMVNYLFPGLKILGLNKAVVKTPTNQLTDDDSHRNNHPQ